MARPHLSWQESVWLTDVDDTLIDTAGISTTASRGIYNVLHEHGISTSLCESVQQNFDTSFTRMMDGYRVKQDSDWHSVDGGKQAFDDLVGYFENHQRHVIRNYGHMKKWSREVFIKWAADQVGLSLSPKLVTACADAYWSELANHSELFPDALRLSQIIADHDRPLILVTSSDARLHMLPDGQFEYDPVHSEKLKTARMEQLRAKGLSFSGVSIGDPEDKPSVAFFGKALAVAEGVTGHPVRMENAIMIGDSFGGDLQTPREHFGFALVALRQSEVAEPQVHDEHYVTVGNLHDITGYLSK